MKILNLIIILSLFLVAGCTEKKSVSPSPAAKTSFESRFGKDGSVKWELSADKSYIASLTISGHPAKAYFSEDGKWIKTETEFLSSELPAVIIKTVLGAYKGSTISKSLLVDELNKELVYRLSLKRGGEIKDVVLSQGGVILGTP
jgi:hypothetical protein